MSDDQHEQPGMTNVHVNVNQSVTRSPSGCGAVLIVGILAVIAMSGWPGVLFVALIVAAGIYLGLRRK